MHQVDKFADFAGLEAAVVVNRPDFNVRPIFHANKVTLIEEKLRLVKVKAKYSFLAASGPSIT